MDCFRRWKERNECHHFLKTGLTLLRCTFQRSKRDVKLVSCFILLKAQNHLRGHSFHVPISQTQAKAIVKDGKGKKAQVWPALCLPFRPSLGPHAGAGVLAVVTTEERNRLRKKCGGHVWGRRKGGSGNESQGEERGELCMNHTKYCCIFSPLCSQSNPQESCPPPKKWLSYDDLWAN